MSEREKSREPQLDRSNAGSPRPAILGPQPLTPGQRAWLRFRQNRCAVISGIFLLVLIPLALFWPSFQPPGVAPRLPRAMTWPPTVLSDDQFEGPGRVHWCGTDVHGRDLLSRIVYGARISMLVSVVGAAVSLGIGTVWGALAGYVGGKTDSILMRIVDILYSLPNIVFVIVLVATVEQPLQARLEQYGLGVSARILLIVIGLGAISWLTMARIVRGQVLSLRSRPFIEASRALGASHIHILFRHILPNIYGVIITYLALTVPSIVLYESFLSYLGLGVQPPQASLGSLIAEGAAQINPIRTYWWMIVFPGVTLASTLLSLNFLGDGLRDAWDPRTGSE